MPFMAFKIPLLIKFIEISKMNMEPCSDLNTLMYKKTTMLRVSSFYIFLYKEIYLTINIINRL